MGIKINPNIDFGSFLRSVTSKDKIDQQIQKVTDYLEKKYDEKFEVLRGGDREDKYNDDIKIICHPISNPNIIFYARGNSLEEYDPDNYNNNNNNEESSHTNESQISENKESTKININWEKCKETLLFWGKIMIYITKLKY